MLKNENKELKNENKELKKQLECFKPKHEKYQKRMNESNRNCFGKVG